MRLMLILGTVLLIATTGWIQPSVLVLCIAPGAHVAIEPGQARCAAPEDPGPRDGGPRTAGVAHTEACCTPCTDLPLGSSVLVRSSGSEDHLQQLKAPNLLDAAANPHVRASRVVQDSRTESPRGGASLPTLALETVVLRC